MSLAGMVWGVSGCAPMGVHSGPPLPLHSSGMAYIGTCISYTFQAQEQILCPHPFPERKHNRDTTLRTGQPEEDSHGKTVRTQY
jgi:hypothetical protein